MCYGDVYKPLIKKKTQLDRLKEMNADEAAEFIFRKNCCRYCSVVRECDAETEEDCIRHIKEFLESEAEE